VGGGGGDTEACVRAPPRVSQSYYKAKLDTEGERQASLRARTHRAVFTWRS
jgi:hypothetical protein